MVFGLLGLNNDKDKDKDEKSKSISVSAAAPGFQTAKGCTALVTGSSGLCGARLVELLLERGATTVICFDRAPPDVTLAERFDKVQQTTKGKLVYCHGPEQGDLTNVASVEAAFQAAPKQQQIDVVFHIAALVGPFHDKEKYYDVNYKATLTIIEMCKKYKVPKLV